MPGNGTAGCHGFQVRLLTFASPCICSARSTGVTMFTSCFAGLPRAWWGRWRAGEHPFLMRPDRRTHDKPSLSCSFWDFICIVFQFCPSNSFLFFEIQGGKGTPGPKGDDGDAGEPGPDVSYCLWLSRSGSFFPRPTFYLSSVLSWHGTLTGCESHVWISQQIDIFINILRSPNTNDVL